MTRGRERSREGERKFVVETETQRDHGYEENTRHVDTLVDMWTEKPMK